MDAAAAAVTASVDVASPSAGGVTGVGRSIVTADGAAPTHEVERSTALLKPLRDCSLMVDELELPCDTEMDDGSDVI